MRRLTSRLLPALVVLGTVMAVAVPAAVGDPTPPTGKFVLGNVSATEGAQVKLWGAQWWKDNNVSGGDAPSSFKGWATEVDMTNCTFITRPGDSPPPPDAPQQGEMTLLVTKSVK